MTSQKGLNSQQQRLYFRNKKEINGIDPDALWKKMGPFLVLVDEDQDVRVDFETVQDQFYQVEAPPELNKAE